MAIGFAAGFGGVFGGMLGWGMEFIGPAGDDFILLIQEHSPGFPALHFPTGGSGNGSGANQKNVPQRNLMPLRDRFPNGGEHLLPWECSQLLAFHLLGDDHAFAAVLQKRKGRASARG